ncbi:hypothetical protein [Ornithinimicrobium kibberense]|uniref:hypothetical protein n=1 Tax=Ornithinimicrobium kibberense TaxID=282060 RepID=UPI00360AF0FB
MRRCRPVTSGAAPIIAAGESSEARTAACSAGRTKVPVCGSWRTMPTAACWASHSRT